MQFNRNGVQVRQTQPVRALKRVTRVISIDSRDRDPTKYVKLNGGAAVSDPGDYVVYLPRPFSNVTRIRLKDAIINSPSSGGGWTANDQYLMLGIEGLNRMDETAPGGDRAGYADYSFAKIANPNMYIPSASAVTAAIFYNDASFSENATSYNPPIGTLDRFHITFRRHLPFSGIGATGTNFSPATNVPLNAPIVFGTGENSLTFEIEYLDNVFEDVSAFETFLPSMQGVGR
jgi:hypothetical protein